MKKTFGLLLILVGLIGFLAVQSVKKGEAQDLLVQTQINEDIKPNSTSRPSPANSVLKTPTDSFKLESPKYIAQSYNNCGPASLAMILNFWGLDFTQERLAGDLRPFNNPKGGVDDKAVFNDEMASYAKLQGLQSLVRPNGDIEKLKLFVTNGIPVVITAWLHKGEDIGHYRIVIGFNDNTQTILTDDSYIGPNQTYSYNDFMEMWKPFNYTYLVVYPENKSAVVNEILGEEVDQNRSYQNSIEKAEKAIESDPMDFYAGFNLASANYFLGNFDKTVSEYEKVENKLPPRMLWYQLEPIYAYHQTGNDQKAIELADQLLNNGNLAFSELYQLKGEIYLKQGKPDLAKDMFEKALYYNKNYSKAKESLEKL